MAKSSIVGDLINFRGLVYGPVNEMGVVGLFAKVGEELGFIIEEIRAEFPDCIARRQVDKGWERVAWRISDSRFEMGGLAVEDRGRGESGVVNRFRGSRTRGSRSSTHPARSDPMNRVTTNSGSGVARGSRAR